MAVAPLIAMKSTKCESLEAVGKELDRRAHTYVNDVDLSRSDKNVNFWVRREDGRALPLEESIERRMGELHTRRAVRKDAVKAMGFIVSTNGALSDDDAWEFLRDAVAWFDSRYGSENLLAASVHFDEGVPHAHLWIAPVVRDADGYDRLCAKELFAPDERRKNPETGKWEITAQGTMSQLQQDFWREVASRWGYERPLDHATRAKGYRSLAAFKSHEGVTRELKAERASLEEQVRNSETRSMELNNVIADKQGDLAELDNQLSDVQLDIDAANERLESVQADLRGLESFGQKGVLELGALAAVGAKGDGAGEGERVAAARNRELGERLAALKAEKERTPDELVELEGGAWELADRVDEAGAAREAAQGRVRGLERRRDGLAGRVERLRDAVADALGELEEIARGWFGWIVPTDGLEWVCDRISAVLPDFRWFGDRWGRDEPLARRRDALEPSYGYDLNSESRGAWAASEELERESGYERPRSRGWER